MTEREKFEAWVSASGRAHLLERDHPHLWYKDLTVAAWWTAWQAALESRVSEQDRIDAERTDDGAQRFACYLIDHCEGETLSEENIQRWLGKMLTTPQYSAKGASK